MLPCVVVPDLAGFDWPAARLPEFVGDRPSMSDDFLKAALPPSCSRTGRCVAPGVYPRCGGLDSTRRRRHRSTRAVDPCALTGRRGARRSFWDVGPQGLTAGTPRQKVRWPIPLMCLVPSAGPEPLVWFFLTVTATATTEPRGVARGSALVTRGTTVRNRSSSSREFRGTRLDFSVH